VTTLHRLALLPYAPLVAAAMFAALTFATTDVDGIGRLVMAIAMAGFVFMAVTDSRVGTRWAATEGWDVARTGFIGVVVVLDGISVLFGSQLAEWSLGIWSLPLGVFLLAFTAAGWAAVKQGRSTAS
jgi:hypothetical protein